jgi:hypothetical protein
VEEDAVESVEELELLGVSEPADEDEVELSVAAWVAAAARPSRAALASAAAEALAAAALTELSASVVVTAGFSDLPSAGSLPDAIWV